MDKVLIINNSFVPVQIALKGKSSLLFFVEENPPSRYPNNILFVVKSFFDAFRISPDNLDAIAVSVGPGSFTGTRIAVVESKILAYTLGIPLIPIDALDIIGSSVKDGYAGISAGRKEVFAAKFENGKRMSNNMCISVSEAEKLDNLFFPSEEEVKKAKLKNAKIAEVTVKNLLEITEKKISSNEFSKDPLAVNPVYLRSTDIIFKKKK